MEPMQTRCRAWLAYAEEHDVWTTPREGIRVALFSVMDTHTRHGKTYNCQRAMQITERTIMPQGQPLVLPAIEIEGW
jgi:hypothetical protein